MDALATLKQKAIELNNAGKIDLEARLQADQARAIAGEARLAYDAAVKAYEAAAHQWAASLAE